MKNNDVVVILRQCADQLEGERAIAQDLLAACLVADQTLELMGMSLQSPRAQIRAAITKAMKGT